MVHSDIPIGQSSKEGGAQVFEADDWPSIRGQQDLQVLNSSVHAAIHVDTVKSRTSVWHRTKKISAFKCPFLELLVLQYHMVF